MLRTVVMLLIASTPACLLVQVATQPSPASQPTSAASRPAAGPPLPRIIVRQGQFVRSDTGEPFRPRGFNYEHFKPAPLGYLGTFSPKRYDPAAADAMLADLQTNGFNLVRVFIDPGTKYGEGIVESPQATELAGPYVDNFVDFLARARNHSIHVLVTLDGLPQCARYQAITGPVPEGMNALNAHMLSQPFIDAAAKHVEDFVSAIKVRNASLLTTVFAFQLWNEAYYGSGPPFSHTMGKITPASGQTYDLSSRDDLQRMADDHVIRWADACVAAARKVDPGAMVTVGVFTPHAVGRAGPGAVRPEDSRDYRIPFRPLATMRSKLSFLDIHFYPSGPETLDADLKSIEFESLKAASIQQGKPLLMGEFGAFRGPYRTLPEARQAMIDHIHRALGLGFAGWLYWTYDSYSQRDMWQAKARDGELFTALAEEVKMEKARP